MYEATFQVVTLAEIERQQRLILINCHIFNLNKFFFNFLQFSQFLSLQPIPEVLICEKTPTFLFNSSTVETGLWKFSMLCAMLLNSTIHWNAYLFAEEKRTGHYWKTQPATQVEANAVVFLYHVTSEARCTKRNCIGIFWWASLSVQSHWCKHFVSRNFFVFRNTLIANRSVQPCCVCLDGVNLRWNVFVYFLIGSKR